MDHNSHGTVQLRAHESRRDHRPQSAVSTEPCDATTMPLLDHGFQTTEDPQPNSVATDNQISGSTRSEKVRAKSSLCQEKPSTMLPGWPSFPKPLKTPMYIRILNSIFDVLLLACSVAFLAFALVVNRHDQDSTAEHPRLTKTLVNATKYGPTVFPILYASIVGRAAHAVLLWRLERGERIGILDTLASSTSLTSTVTSQLQLRSLSILGVALLAVWSLSPIGGQASVRIMTIGLKDTEIHDSLAYMVNSGYLGSYISAEMNQQGSSSASAAFVAALMASPTTKSSPLDLWGNVKIPRIRGLEGVTAMSDDGWYLANGRDVDEFSSPIGIPIAGINDSKFINYFTRVHSPYLDLDCSMNHTDTEGPSNNILGSSGMLSNATGQGSNIFWNAPSLGTTINSSQEDRDDILPDATSPLMIRYLPTYEHAKFTLTCNVTQTYIEAEIECPTHTTCAAKRVRRSRLNQFPSAWTLLDLSKRTPNLLFKGMLSTGNGKLRYPQLLDRYLSDPNLVNSNYANVTEATEDKYTVRLGQVLNAYFACLNGFFAITAGVNNETAYSWDNNQTFTVQRETAGNQNSLWEEQYSASFAADRMFKTKTWTSEATKVQRIEVIVAHRGWVIALCIASTVLIFSSLVAPLIHHFLTVGVDVAMNISSLATRHNPYMALPQTGTYLDASNRARLLAHHKIRFGDAEATAEVGKLVIGSSEGNRDEWIAKVKKSKLYK